MKVSQLLLDVRDTQDIRDSTFKCWLKAAKPLADIDVSDIDRVTVNRYWKSQLKPIGTLSPETLRRRLSLLTGIWNMATEEELIDVPNYWLNASKKLKLIMITIGLVKSIQSDPSVSTGVTIQIPSF